jgi:hypothetical protein
MGENKVGKHQEIHKVMQKWSPHQRLGLSADVIFFFVHFPGIIYQLKLQIPTSCFRLI